MRPIETRIRDKVGPIDPIPCHLERVTRGQENNSLTGGTELESTPKLHHKKRWHQRITRSIGKSIPIRHFSLADYKATNLYVFAPSQTSDSLQRLPCQANQLQLKTCKLAQSKSGPPDSHVNGSFVTNSTLCTMVKEGALTNGIQHGLVFPFTGMAS
jgi:hypothetical protein